MVTANPEIPNIRDAPELGTQLSSAPARPVVLFPVRLETRFFAQADGSSELRVRIYPDKVHIDSHEPELTADELTWGRHFWEQTWRAASDQERGKAVWRQLADRFDPPRAAWVARALKPLNPEDRPANPLPTDQPLPKAPRFPSPTTKTESWTRAPHTRVLPNFWVVLGYKNARLITNAKGRAIQDLLTTGPKPGPSLPRTPPDQLAIDDGMKWMVDFDAAENVGMGVRARLNKEDAAAGFDFLLVMGIKDSSDGAQRLSELFDAHHYTDGLSFVAQGTPSNNTVDAPSGFSSTDPGHETSYVAERTTSAFQAGDGSNADVLTTAFGLPNASQVFASLTHATAKEQLDVRHMNTALWQASWGYFLLQMLGVGETSENPLTDDDIAWIRSHFIRYVRANGPLPTLRVGKQPYGILPVTSLNAWQPASGQQAHSARDTALGGFLFRLRDIWRRNFPEIPRLGRSDDIQKDLAEVLTMDGLSSGYSIRNLLGRHYLEHLFVFLSAEYLSGFWTFNSSMSPELFERFRSMRAQTASLWWTAQEQLPATVLQALGVTWRPRLARALFSPPVVALRGALVQADGGRSLSPNYIQSMLAARDLGAIRDETIQQPSPPTLLYLLLRHSMLLEYVTAAWKLLVKRGLLQPGLRRESELVNLREGQPTNTVWEQMKTRISVTGVGAPMEVGKYLLGFIPSGEPDIGREPDVEDAERFSRQPKSSEVAQSRQTRTIDDRDP